MKKNGLLYEFEERIHELKNLSACENKCQDADGMIIENSTTFPDHCLLGKQMSRDCIRPEKF
jgi:hypothetical protein